MKKQTFKQRNVVGIVGYILDIQILLPTYWYTPFLFRIASNPVLPNSDFITNSNGSQSYGQNDATRNLIEIIGMSLFSL